MTNQLAILGVKINKQRQSYDLYDIYKASGLNDEAKQPNRWVDSAEGSAMIEAARKELDAHCLTIDGAGNILGSLTMVIAYASWLAPEFMIKAFSAIEKFKQEDLTGANRPTALQARFDQVEAGLRSGVLSPYSADLMMKEAIQSNWNQPAALGNSNGERSIYEDLMHGNIIVSGDAYLEPKTMSVHTAITTAKEGEYGNTECFTALNRIGIDIYHADLAFDVNSIGLREKLNLTSGQIRDALMTVRGMREGRTQIKMGKARCIPLLLPLISI